MLLPISPQFRMFDGSFLTFLKQAKHLLKRFSIAVETFEGQRNHKPNLWLFRRIGIARQKVVALSDSFVVSLQRGQGSNEAVLNLRAVQQRVGLLKKARA